MLLIETFYSFRIVIIMSLLYKHSKDTVKNTNFRTFRGTIKGVESDFSFILKLLKAMSQKWFTSTPVCVFVDHAFLRAQCLRSILQHVSPLTVGAYSRYSLL